MAANRGRLEDGAVLARLRSVSAVAHAPDSRMRRIRRGDGVDDYVFISDIHNVPGPGVAGGLLRLGHGVTRLGRSLRRVRDAARAREGKGEDAPAMSMGDTVAVDVMVGVTNIVVGACDVVVGACDLAPYARGALARLRSKAFGGGGANSNLDAIEDGSPLNIEGGDPDRSNRADAKLGPKINLYDQDCEGVLDLQYESL